jgi:hypothetical protein
MKNAYKNTMVLCLVLALSFFTVARGANGGAAKGVTGHYEGTAKNKAEEVITVALDLTEKDGSLSGMIKSSHGDFAITGGSHKGDSVTIEFDANGAPGTLNLNMSADKLVGSWSAGDDGGAVDVKKGAAQEAPKGK